MSLTFFHALAMSVLELFLSFLGPWTLVPVGKKKKEDTFLLFPPARILYLKKKKKKKEGYILLGWNDLFSLFLFLNLENPFRNFNIWEWLELVQVRNLSHVIRI